MARTNDRGLIIDHIIELDANQATMFYWGLTAIFAIGLVLGILGLISALTERQYVELTEREITIPRLLWRGKTSVPYATIKKVYTQVYTQTATPTVYLLMEHDEGKVYLNGSYLPSKADFEAVALFVSTKTRK